VESGHLRRYRGATGGIEHHQPAALPGTAIRRRTALHYNYFRDYDPTLGRYIESDPIGLDGGINTYAYVGANPLRWFDPSGLDQTIWFNTQGGRPWYDGPTNGNWGGKCWSGGQYSCDGHPMGTAAPTDSGDKCYKDHDSCYAACGTDANCLAKCNKNVVTDLNNLSDDPKKWPQPPRVGTERDSAQYRRDAIDYFGDATPNGPPAGP
jgi:RHS repeat-associated protein